MSVTFLLHGADVTQHLGSLTQLDLKSLSTDSDTKQVYIKGSVKKSSQIQRTKCQSLIKAIITQDGLEVPVFFLGKCAEEVQQLATGDTIFLSSMIIENNTQEEDDQFHFQLILDPSKSHPKILILHVKHHSVEVPDTQSASTSKLSLTKPQKTRSQRSYNYKQLKDIKGGDIVNVYGVVKYFKPPVKTRGSDYSMFVSIIDKSGGDKLKCLIFARDVKNLPPISSVGEVVRFHRLQIREFNDELQGQANCGCGFSCLVYSGDVNGSLTPQSTVNTYTCTESDIEKVIELREWASDDVLSQQTGNPSCSATTHSHQTSLQHCRVGQFIDLVCQVVAKCQLDSKCFLLKVWDGTYAPFPIKEEDLSSSHCLDWLHVDEELQSMASGYTFDIYVFDDHFDKASVVEPGDVIKLTNLHAAQYPDRNPSARHTIVPVELTLHGGGARYNRDLTKLDDSHPDVILLKEQLTATGLLQGDSPALHSPVRDEDPPRSDSTQHQVLSHGIFNEAKTMGTSDYDCENRCMMNTATVLTANHDQGSSTIREVVQHPVPYKFRLMCHTKDYMPKPDTPSDLVRLYCPKCHYMSTIPGSDSDVNDAVSSPMYYKQDNGLILYACPVCKGKIFERVLQHTMMVQFLLHDSTGWIVAGLWKQEAETFFRDITAADILLDREAFHYVKTRLSRLIQPKTSNILPEGSVQAVDHTEYNPLLECCIKSYSTSKGVSYQIFDTCLEWSDLDR